MKQKIIFFDIDGTLLPFKGEVPQSTISAIKMLKENGHIPVICTGRCMAMTKGVSKKLNMNSVVAGAGTFACLDNNIIYNRTLIKEDIVEGLDILKSCDLAVIGEGPENLYFDYKMDDSKDNELFDATFKKWADNCILSLSTDMVINKFSCKIKETSDINKAISLMEDKYTCINHNNQLLEFVPKPYSKAYGIEKMITALKIPREDTFAIGDSDNDLEMIKYVNTGIAMGNALDSIKKIADYVTTDINDNGIYNALKEFELI